jgi:5-methylcytosine-specific restriction endonuclease McrA
MPDAAPAFRSNGAKPMIKQERDRAYDATRRNDPDRRFQQSSEWRYDIRPKQLLREPLCRHCKANDRVAAASVVDHIIKPMGNAGLQRDPNNFQSLCASCLSNKGVRDRASGE